FGTARAPLRAFILTARFREHSAQKKYNIISSIQSPSVRTRTGSGSMVERSLGVRETPGSIPGSPNPGPCQSVVFCYSQAPSGHYSVANALKDEFQELAPNVRTSALALSPDMFPFLGPAVSRIYLKLVQQTPR